MSTLSTPAVFICNNAAGFFAASRERTVMARSNMIMTMMMVMMAMMMLMLMIVIAMITIIV